MGFVFEESWSKDIDIIIIIALMYVAPFKSPKDALHVSVGTKREKKRKASIVW